MRFHSHKEIRFRSLKNYKVDDFKNLLHLIEFPNYETFNDVDKAYEDFFLKLTNAINRVAPYKVARIKGNTPEWFDIEISEKIHLRDKLFRKFKKSHLNIDRDLYNEARNTVQRTIKQKKENFIAKTLEENVKNPKKLWDTTMDH